MITIGGHYFQLHSVSLFQSRSVRKNIGRFIQPGMQEVELITGGVVYFNDEEGNKPYGCGAQFWHRCGEQTVHLTDPSKPYSCLVVRFLTEQDQLLAMPRLSLWRDPAECQRFAQDALRGWHREDDRDQLGAWLWATMQLRGGAGGEGDAALPSPVRLCLATIRQHYMEELDAVDLAKAANVSQPHLYHLFRKHLQETPHQALLNRRIAEARILLATTTAGLNTIANQCGFRDSSALCRQFAKQLGVTPSHYRRENAAPNE